MKTSNQERNTGITVKCCMGLLLAVGLALLLSGSASAASFNMTTPANLPWNDTGILVNAGDTLTINASGTWSGGIYAGTTVLSNGPDGYTGTYQGEANDNWVPSAYWAALVGRIGTNAAPTYFAVGSHLSYVSATSGELYLGINDGKLSYVGDQTVSYNLRDNTGSLTVSGSTVPEPATLSLLGLGLAGLLARRKRK